MTVATDEKPPLMTTEQLLALPDDGIDRELICGSLLAKPRTLKTRRHGRTAATLAFRLDEWLDTQSRPRGEILSGGATFRLRRDPDTTVSVDVAYISAEMALQTPDEAEVIEGPPVIAVEILSPWDSNQDIAEKIMAYLEAGVKLVWVADPVFERLRCIVPTPSRSCSTQRKRSRASRTCRGSECRWRRGSAARAVGRGWDVRGSLSMRKGTGDGMIRAIVRNGAIQPLDPLPQEWQEGKELIVEAETVVPDAQTLADWQREMDEALASNSVEEDEKFLKALADNEAESKEAVRRAWGLK